MTPEFTITDLARHVRELGERYDIFIHYHNECEHARAFSFSNEIETPFIVSYRTYAIAMHELGHLLGHGQDRGCLSAERGAWTWARNHALMWTAEMQSEMDACQSWYKANRKTEHARWKADRNAFQ